MDVNPLSMAEPVVDDNGRPLRNLNLFSEGASKLPMLKGIGSPEGVVASRQDRIYRDTTGVAGSILYVKNVDDVAGDKTMGWILV